MSGCYGLVLELYLAFPDISSDYSQNAGYPYFNTQIYGHKIVKKGVVLFVIFFQKLYFQVSSVIPWS